jgi:hypothetical protein
MYVQFYHDLMNLHLIIVVGEDLDYPDSCAPTITVLGSRTASAR